MESCRSNSRLLWTLTRSCIREPKRLGCECNRSSLLYFWGPRMHGGEPTGMLMKTRSISAAEMNFFRGFKKYWRAERKKNCQGRKIKNKKKNDFMLWNRQPSLPELMRHSERASALGKRIRQEQVFILLSITLFWWLKETYRKRKYGGPC